MSLESAFAFFDAKFFYVNNEPRVREIAVLGELFEGVYEFDPNINEESLSSADRRRNDYIRKNILGLPYVPVRSTFGLPVLTQKDFIPLVKEIANKLTQGERKYFAINSKQLAEILANNNIPFITWGMKDIVSDNDWVCAYHTETQSNLSSRSMYKCALRKCYDMYHDYRSRFVKNV